MTFNTKMKTSHFQLGEINSDILDIYIIPVDIGMDPYKLNFTWKVVSYENKELKIQLEFTNFPYVSTQSIFDQIVVHIKSKEHFFISQEYLVDISDAYSTLTTSI